MNNDEDISKWLHDNLSALLSFPVPHDLTSYILTIENERDIDDFMKTLLDLSNARHVHFLENFKIMRHWGTSKKGYRKGDIGNGDHAGKNSDKKQRKLLIESNKKDNVDSPPETTSNGLSQQDSLKKSQHSKKKSKFVNLFSPEGEKDIIFLKGRHHCDCQASKHSLVNNCLKCGRIVCTQEGSGPCIFCGALVCSKEEMDFISADTKQSKKLYDSLMDVGKMEAMEKALQHRDKLLEYDITSEKRTRVIDDEGEYFSSTSVWLSDAERDKLKKKEEEALAKKHASRLDQKFTFDFAGRKVMEDEMYDDFGEDYYKEAIDNVDRSLAVSSVHPGISVILQPTYVDSGNSKVRNTDNIQRESKINCRVQDKEFLEMTDQGACLSLHQPFASLLVSGIMRHEGRNWYTSHRGRLWIASASKTPMDQEIKEAEIFFYNARHGAVLNYPNSYPTSCLLGCVSLVDCLPQEEYRKRFPDGESDSPFVFICEDARELDLKFPITGQHKIYKLESKIHQAAVKSLLRLARDQSKAH